MKKTNMVAPTAPNRMGGPGTMPGSPLSVAPSNKPSYGPPSLRIGAPSAPSIAPSVAGGIDPNAPLPLSGAAARLLAKTANDKKKAANTQLVAKSKSFRGEVPTSPLKSARPAADEGSENDSDFDPNLPPERNVDEAVARAQALVKDEAERQRLKDIQTNIRVTIRFIKHLPKMDKFGKTDAYCVLHLNNERSGGKKFKRRTKTIKHNLNPEWQDAIFHFPVYNYPEHELGITVWDWDAGAEDEIIGTVHVPLSVLYEEVKYEKSYQVQDRQHHFITGHDGSPCVVRVVLEKDVSPDDLDVSIQNLVGDSEEVRTLDCSEPPWESAVRGLMFDIENSSDYPILITNFKGQSGRACNGSCAYTIYRAPGRWNVGRCPCNRIFPCKYCSCCCGGRGGRENFACMKCCCRCTPCTYGRIGCCWFGECGEGRELAEPCCEGCIPCCTGNCTACILVIPFVFPFFCFFCGCGTPKRHGGLSEPGCPIISCCRCCGYECCRDGVHRQADKCFCCGSSCNCSCNSTCCFCCRKKYFDRRRWTRVTSGWVDLPSDWGHFADLPSLKDFESGGVLIPPKQTMAFYIHSPHPEKKASAQQALAIRGPYKRGFQQGDVTNKDRFLKLRTGPYTDSTIPFANSHMTDKHRDGQYYDLDKQHLHEYQVCAFAGKVEYRILDKKDVPRDCVTLCGHCPYCC